MRRGVALVLALAAAGCGRPAPRSPFFDLAATTPAADPDSRWQVVLFGSASGIAHQLAGFFDAPARLGEDGSAWVTRAPEIGLRWQGARPRVLLLDMAPFAGLARQSAEVFLNDAKLGAVALEPRRRRYRVDLPAGPQNDGFNKLRLAFAEVTEAQKPYRKRMAAVLYGLVIADGSDEAVADLLAPEAPPPVSVSDAALAQAVPGALRWVFRAPADAELRVGPALHPLARSAGAEATLSITIEEDGKPARALWSAGLGPRSTVPAEVALPLGVPAGALVRLSLAVEGGRFAWAAWGAPRVFGRASGDRLAALPAMASPSPEPRLETLRRSLADANVVYVILDAAGARHFPAYGYARRATPEIDRIAAEGVVFEDAYSVATITLMSMGSAWTSVYPDQHHNGVVYNAPMPRDRLTLAELLGANGVHTAGFVSNGLAGPGFALERGFAEFDEVFRKLGSSAEAYRKVLPGWLGQNGGRRFFLYVHFREPHFAYDPPPPFDTMLGPAGPLTKKQRTDYGWITDVNWKRVTPTPDEVEHLRRLYDGNLAYVDRELGELRRAMEAAGLWDRSLVIVSADHGDQLYEHGYVGHLDQVYEEALRIPLVVKLPKAAGVAGARVKGLVDTLDVAPTVADTFGVLGRGGSERAFHGRSLLPMLFGAPGKEAAFARCAGEQPKYGLRHGRHKVVYHTARNSAELYDVVADPGELRDLAPGQPLFAAYYRQTIARWLLEMRRGPRGTAEEAQLTDERRENLKALGYVQ